MNRKNNQEFIRAAIIYILYLVPILLLYLIKGITKDRLAITIIHILLYPLAFTVITYLIVEIIKEKKKKKLK